MHSSSWHRPFIIIGVIRNPACLVFIKGLIKDGMGEGNVEEHHKTRKICFSWAEQWLVSLEIITISSHLFSSHKWEQLGKLYLKSLNSWFLKLDLLLRVLRHLHGTISRPSHKSQRLAVYHYDWSSKTGSMQLIPESENKCIYKRKCQERQC